MTVIFADTFYLLVNPNDSRHEQALAFSAAFAGKMIKTCWIITELADVLANRANRPALEALFGQNGLSLVVLQAPVHFVTQAALAVS
ncbi:MAG: hypothetical protein ACJ8FY_28325 [Gemmataceae bacterium]